MVENAFGIMAIRFRIFYRPIDLQVEKVTDIILATCSLHNFLRSSSSSTAEYAPQNVYDLENADGSLCCQDPTSGIQPLRQQNYNHSFAVKAIREEFADYFLNKGAIPWQNSYMH